MMKQSIFGIPTYIRFLLCALLLANLQCLLNTAHAEGKKEGGAGADSISRLEPFVVNLASFERYLQVMVSLQVASPEVAEKIKLYMPKVRHHIIILLSSKESSEIQSTQGKHDLIDSIKHRLNQALDLKEHDGITDIYFENFVVQ